MSATWMVPLDTPVRVRFSEPMDRPSTQAAFFLLWGEGSPVAGAFSSRYECLDGHRHVRRLRVWRK